MANDIPFLEPGQEVTIRAAGTRKRGTKDLPNRVLSPGDSVEVIGLPLPGLAGTPQFAVISSGVMASWAPAARAATYRLNGNNLPQISAAKPWWKEVMGPGVTLPVGFMGWFCVRPVNDVGEAPDQSCNSYAGAPTPTPDPEPAPEPDPDPIPAPDPDPVPDPTPDPVPVPEPVPTPTPTPTPGGLFYEKNWANVPLGVLPRNQPGPGDITYVFGKVEVVSGTLIDGTIGRFIRSTYMNGPGDPNQQAGVDLDPPNAVAVRPREVWLDASIRYNHPSWAETTDDKTIFVTPDYRYVTGSGPGDGQSAIWRWACHLSGQGRFWGGPYPQGGVVDWMFFDPTTDEVFNGQWHRLRLHFKMASNETAKDGIYEALIDNVRVMSRTSLFTANPAAAFFNVISLSRNSNPAVGATRDWGPVKYYTTNPGW